jgi:hypothetical protein
MKGKTHLLVTFAVMSFFVFWSYRFLFKNEYNFIIITLAFACVIIGSILPDADMTDNKSKVLHGVFLPIGLIVRLFEYPLAFVLGEKAKHRGVLHHPLGILFSSLIVLVFLSVILYFLGLLSFIVIIYFYIITAASQFLHILEDAFSDYFIYFVIILAIIVFLIIKFGKIS